MATREDQEYSSQAPAPYIGQFLQQGIFPYASKFLQDQFKNYGSADSSPYTYSGQRVAGFDPREQYGMELSDSAIGSYRPYLKQQSNLLDQAASTTRDSFKQFDPSSTQRYYNPYEDQVVEQTMKDVREGLAKGDMGLRDQAVSGGAFGGSRSRLRRGELAEDTARGAAEQIAAIRSGGYQDSANRAQQAFESQQGRQAGFAGQQAGLAGQRAGFAGQEGQAALARGQQFGNLEVQQAQAKMNRGQALNASEQMAVDNQLARGTQLNALDQQQFGNQLQQGQQLGQMGQQQFNMGLQGGQGIAGIGSQMGQGMSQIGQQYGGMGQALQGLQGNDVQSMMGMGGLGRGRQQSLMDLNYQNFTGQYNLPMQTLQNVGALTASLGPMAGGYGYAGGDPTYNNTYAPTGGIGGGVAGGAGNPNAGLPGIYNGAGQGGGNAGGTGGGYAAGNGFSQPITQQVF